jgi:hypothetical protein
VDGVIYIPTRGRTHRQLTWESISPQWRDRTFLVAPGTEAPTLRHLGFRVIEQPAYVKSIGQKRQWVFEQHDETIWGPYAVMFDDDLRFAMRRLDEPTKFESTLGRPEMFDDMMGRLVALLAEFPLAGIRNRSGANRETDLLLFNRRQHDVLAVDVRVMRRHDFRLDRAILMEDFDFVLQYLTAGYSNALLNTFTEDDAGRASEGGCADERGVLEQELASHWLAKQWPDYVTVVEKETKGVGDWATRTDVRVQWAKAAKSGLLSRGYQA